jgi:hypothetical protein
MEYPWLFPWLRRSVNGKDNAHGCFIFLGKLPYDELVIFAMTAYNVRYDTEVSGRMRHIQDKGELAEYEI